MYKTLEYIKLQCIISETTVRRTIYYVETIASCNSQGLTELGVLAGHPALREMCEHIKVKPRYMYRKQPQRFRMV